MSFGRYQGTVDQEAQGGFQFIEWTFPVLITGMAADFFSPTSGEGLLLNVDGNTVDFAVELGAGITSFAFLGITSTIPFDTVLFSSDGLNASSNEFWGAEDLAFAPVPLPPAMLFLASGLFGLMFKRRR